MPSSSPRSASRASSRAPSTKSATSSVSRTGSGKLLMPKSRPSSKRAITRKISTSSTKTVDEESDESGNRPSSTTGRRVRVKSADINARGLKAINMSGQGMTIVPVSIFTKKDLGELDMSSNNLRVLPPEIRRLTNLVYLDLSKNGLRCLHPHDQTGIPQDITHLSHLEVLLISECNLPFIPPAIWGCKSLRVLDISRNKINILVPEVGQLERLEHLNAQQTSIVTLPAEIAFCQELEEILLWGNIVESLPDTLKEMPKLNYLAINFRSFCSMVDSYMEGLLRKGQILSEHLPPVLFEMPQLDLLDLEGTKINNLPEHCVGKLQEFYLAKNFFQSMPKVVLTIESLKILDISGNMVTVIQPQISNLVNLEVLKLNNNNIDNIPTCIGDLKHLHELALGGNKIVAVPSEIGKLKRLKTLILNSNRLVTLPDTITELDKLETLDLTDNQLTSLPISFYKMKGLTSAHTYKKFHKYGLWLHLNPLQTPPPEIWKTDDPKQIYKYLKRLQIMKTENLQRQKIIVMGEAQCGKTSLIRTLMTGKSSLNNSKNCTEGVDFLAWRTDNDVDFIIYDFSGDKVYQPIHNMLLDPKAIYIIVYDHRKYTPQLQATAIGYWLDILQLLVPRAVVKIVGTQCDQINAAMAHTTKEQVERDLEQWQSSQKRRLEEELENTAASLSQPHYIPEQIKKQQFTIKQLLKYPMQISSEISLVSSADGIRGIPELINELELLAVNKELFPHAQRFIPNTWTSFRKALKLRDDYCLTMQEVTSIAKTFDIAPNTVGQVLHYLYDVGEVLWFYQNPALQEIVFQRPRGTLEILHGIFRNDQESFLNYETNRLFASKGQFSKENFETAKHHFDQFGEMSRSFLLSLWFYVKMREGDFEFLQDLVYKLDLCYIVPQPDVPPQRSEFVPLMVVPSFNKDGASFNKDGDPEACDDIWANPLPSNVKELALSLIFPLSYPQGIFEKMSCRIHNKVETRIDFHNVVYATLCDSQIRMSRELSPETYDCIIKVSVRSEDIASARNTINEIFADVRSLLSECPGLVWYVSLSAHNSDGLTKEDCFTNEILTCF